MVFTKINYFWILIVHFFNFWVLKEYQQFLIKIPDKIINNSITKLNFGEHSKKKHKIINQGFR